MRYILTLSNAAGHIYHELQETGTRLDHTSLKAAYYEDRYCDHTISIVWSYTSGVHIYSIDVYYVLHIYVAVIYPVFVRHA